MPLYHSGHHTPPDDISSQLYMCFYELRLFTLRNLQAPKAQRQRTDCAAPIQNALYRLNEEALIGY
jgi:hypothetical protein